MQKKASIFEKCVRLFVFLLPWQTVYIYQEVFVDGVKIQSLTKGFFLTELFLWLCFFMFMYSYAKRIHKHIAEIHFKLTHERIFFLGILMFILYIMATNLWAQDKEISIQNDLHILEGLLFFVMIFFSSLDKKKLATWFVGGATLASLLGVGQYIFQSTFSSTMLGLSAYPVFERGVSVVSSEHFGRWIRAYGPFAHPNVFGGYLFISLLITFFLFLSFDHIKNKKLYIFLCISTFLQLTAFFFTFSRSAWLSLLIFVVGWTFLNKKIQRGVWYGLFYVGVLSFVFFPLIWVRLFGGSTYEVNSMHYRTVGYREAFQVVHEHPFVGVGAGNYVIELFKRDTTRSPFSLELVHDVPLLFVAELGIVGLFFFLMILWSGLRLCFMTFSKSGKALCFLLIFSSSPLWLFDHYLYSSYVGILFSSLFGLLFCFLPTYYAQLKVEDIKTT
ncbi:MAG: hypothetical protein COV59_00805 [Candidatus Magasanikbacteria bacterium CG11_big_fil_rev_8_21_14_0_20_39_34]|uniref:O-antigen ligase-related domain-containing protein n=1 Tax=Candidatus Magasanikbacteria bacterium CG11_big_fil_rev_8_21_14_0_20_39_34 TaxID=1974653 RepID=A0A2H0N636_9BACT|nr:MAG: hypothetical protein COV59_00805 [Candidatus Magasanikbacteria bacterium CG11_big_fil_rev_8_21_14_0_20_39_34]